MATDTFLNICKEVHNKLGMQGTLTTVNVSGYQGLMVDLVRTQWRDIQHSRDDFFFLRAKKDLIVTAGQQEYSLYNAGVNDIFTLAESQRFGTWRTQRFMYNYRPLRYVGFDEWEEADRTTAVAKPTIFTVDPSDDSVIFENLSANATVSLGYIKSAHLLTNDADVPEIPIKQRDVIMWAGVLACAEQFGNADAQNKATIGYEHSLGVFYRHQVPQKSVVTPSIA